MNSTTSSSCQSVTYDGDIAGFGVRFSFYFQNFILVLLVDRSYEDAENALWTFIATSFGLTIAALVQVGLHSLSLLEGILVSQLTWLANIGTFLALASYSRSKGEDAYVKVAAVLQGYISMILTIVMWKYADHIHSDQECLSKFRFVWMFGWDLPALTSGRTVALVFASLAMGIYTAITFTECKTWLETRKSRLHKHQRHDVERPHNTADRHRRPSGGSAHYSHGGHGLGIRRPNMMGPGRHRPPNRIEWLGVDIDPIFFGIFLSQIIVYTYFISTTELTIKKSRASVADNNKWGFGQVLALTVVIPSLIALLRAMKRNSVRRRNRERGPEMESEIATPIMRQPRLRQQPSNSSVPSPTPVHLRLTSSQSGTRRSPAVEPPGNASSAQSTSTTV